MTLTATASDDVGVVRVEAYKNLELVASIAAPPYNFSVDASPGEHFYVTVEAIDAAGNRGTRHARARRRHAVAHRRWRRTAAPGSGRRRHAAAAA